MNTTLTSRHATIIIGAGQAGLSAAWHLTRAGHDVVVLDAHERVGDVWRRRWDSLRLFTPAAYDGLPGMPFPAPRWHLPTKDEVAEYLESYARRFAIPVRTGTRVERLARDDGRFVLDTTAGRMESNAVIVATGAFHVPRVPAFAGDLAPDIVQVHSSAYRNPAQLPPGATLVVGAGNSGAQIAMELAESGRTVWLSGPEVGSLPRRMLGRDLYWWIWNPVLRRPVAGGLGARLSAKQRLAGDPLIGLSPRRVTASGVRRVGRTVGVRDGVPLIEGGQPLAVRSVVWCSGFRPSFDWVELPVFREDGMPRHRGGVVEEVPGLYFMGLRHLHRINSSLLGGVGEDAERIADHLLARARTASQALSISPALVRR